MNAVAEQNKSENQIRIKQRTVDYDVKEYPVEVVVNKYINGLESDENEIFIPSYQRAFVWDKKRQSKFIESIILGLPIPYIFTAEGEDGRLEIVDGSQRVRTLSSFLSDELELNDLDILSDCNKMRYSDFSTARQRKIRNTSLRMIVLSEYSDDDTKFMLFERINTGSDLLKDMEKRKGSFPGPFTDLIYDLAALEVFKNTTKFTEKAEKRGEPQELILRFFAYSDIYNEYRGNVNNFLNDYVQEMNKNGFDVESYKNRFTTVLNFINSNFPNGFLQEKHHNYTGRGRFEALAIGTYLALEEKPDLTINNLDWLNSQEFIKKITGSSTNTVKNLKGRVDYVKTKLLNNG